jgi:hypothetical protein
MIPVTPQAEPADFSRLVRRPGGAFLRRSPPPTTSQIRANKFWRFCHDDLHYLYRGLCAFSAQWTPRTKTPAELEKSSVDHYVPISEDHSLAYEWSNYRLARVRLNNNKGSSIHVMDPFHIQNDWFVLNFRSFLVRPNNELPPYLEIHIEKTIDDLDLNHNDFVQERIGVLQAFADESPRGVPFTFLEEKYPFIAYELTRQGEVDAVRVRMRRRLRV